MVTTLVQTEVVALDDSLARQARLLVDAGTITEIAFTDRPADRQIDLPGLTLPGFVDLQVNGAGGASVDEATPTALDTVAQAVRSGGATAFLPTLITTGFDALREQIGAVVDWIEGYAGGGATPLGLHLEGPFLESPGAHPSVHFVDPSPQRVDALLAAARGHLRLVTLAPGRAGAPAAVRRLVEAGVTVSLGHATSTEGFAACVDAGARMVTHLFNAMSPAHHRDVGVAGMALDDERLSCTLIVDGAHIAPAMVRNAYRCLGSDRAVLITDAVAAAGMPDGEYRLSGIPVHLRDGVVRDAAGRLAGSALTMGAAADRFLATVERAQPWEAARLAARNPAQLIGAQLGAIAPGMPARFSVRDADGWRCVEV